MFDRAVVGNYSVRIQSSFSLSCYVIAIVCFNITLLLSLLHFF